MTVKKCMGFHIFKRFAFFILLTALVLQTTAFASRAWAYDTPLSSSASPAVSGMGVTFTATAGGCPNYYGGATVTFYDGTASLGMVSADTPYLTTSALSAGTHSITADCQGANSYISYPSNVTSSPLTLPVIPASTPNGPFAYIVNNADGRGNTVSVTDTATSTIIATVKVGTGPRGVTVNPAGTYAFVANYADGTVSVIRISDNTVVATLYVGDGPTSVAVNPAGTRAYVTGSPLSVIDIATNHVIATVPVSAQAVTVNPDGTRVYAGVGNSVSVIDAATNNVTATIALNSGAAFVAVNPDGKHVYAAADGGAGIAVIDTATDKVTTTIPVASGLSGLAVNPDGKHVYVTHSSEKMVSVIDTASNAVIATVDMAGTNSSPRGVAVNPAGTYAFVAGGGSGCLLSVIDTATNTVVVIMDNPIVNGGPATACFQAYAGQFIAPVAVNRPIPTTTTVSSSWNPSVYRGGYGGSTGVGFTATVTPNATGTVTFYDGTAILGEGTLTNGTATAVYSNRQAVTSAGAHSITAVYEGNTDYSGSTSSALTQTIVDTSSISTPFPTTTTLSSSANPAGQGASVTFTATVNYYNGARQAGEGTVTFYDGAIHLGSAVIYTISDGNGTITPATYTTSTLNAGAHAITAVYDDGTGRSFAGSTSPALTQTVQAATASTGLAYYIATSSALSQGGGSLLQSSAVAVVDTSTNTVTATVPVGTYTSGIAVNPAGSRVYVAEYHFDWNSGDSHPGTVDVIDTATNKITAAVTVGTNPSGVAVSPDGTRVYVPSAGDPSMAIAGAVSVIDAATNQVIATVPVAGGTIAVNPDGKHVYVTQNWYGGVGAVSVIDTVTNAVTATVYVGHGPSGLAVNPAGTKVYVADSGSKTISVIDAASNAVIATVTVGYSPKGVAVSPDGKYVYVANNGGPNVSPFISVIDAATNKVIATVTGAGGALAVNPAGTRLYVGGNFGGAVVDTATNTVIATVDMSGAFTYISPAYVHGASSVAFAPANSGSASPVNIFTVSSSAGANGSITPAAQSVAQGNTVSLTVTANTGYMASASGCGGSLNGSTYMTGIIAANCTVSATFAQAIPSTTGTALSLVAGWNLLGNGAGYAPITAANTFGDQTKVTTVWKWVAVNNRWAFYAPSMNTADLASYAANKGYDVLNFINGGEGFWVNAKVGFTAQP